MTLIPEGLPPALSSMDATHHGPPTDHGPAQQSSGRTGSHWPQVPSVKPTVLQESGVKVLKHS